ncbi:MAG: hypothetical protein HY718_11775 [Planctomycetes bacterium]|nr:hypothetical protein [Planctomycetota bacterium]
MLRKGSILLAVAMGLCSLGCSWEKGVRDGLQDGLSSAIASLINAPVDAFIKAAFGG